jgi:hypothetical protein
LKAQIEELNKQLLEINTRVANTGFDFDTVIKHHQELKGSVKISTKYDQEKHLKLQGELDLVRRERDQFKL